MRRWPRVNELFIRIRSRIGDGVGVGTIVVAHLLLGTIALFPLLAAAAVLGAGTFAGIRAARTAGLLLARRYASTELLQTLSSCRKVVVPIVQLIPAGLVIALVLPLILASGSQSFAVKTHKVESELNQVRGEEEEEYILIGKVGFPLLTVWPHPTDCAAGASWVQLAPWASMPGLGRGSAAQTRLMPPSWRWTRTQYCSVWVAAYRWHSRRQAVGVRRRQHDVAANGATAAGSCGCSATAALTVAPAVAVASVGASTAPDTAVESSWAPRRSWRWYAACGVARAGGGGRRLRRLYSTRG